MISHSDGPPPFEEGVVCVVGYGLSIGFPFGFLSVVLEIFAKAEETHFYLADGGFVLLLLVVKVYL